MLLSALAALTLCMNPSTSVEGPWRAWLDCPGGELPFGIVINSAGDHLQAAFVNGSELIDIPSSSFTDGVLTLDMPHYDSRIQAKLDGDLLTGTWRKRRGLKEWTEMDFHARRGQLPRFHEVDAAPGDEIDGRWKVMFESSEDHAVGEFKTGPDGQLEGTFLTTTGDYRFLAGDFAGGELRLSCFDGAHAFLFNARLLEDGTLTGDFWSRDTWHESWTATRASDVSLPDAFEQTAWMDGWSIGDVIFPDLDGKPRSLADPEFAGSARILQVFGSWCPNCNDEARYLSELEEKYGERGLSVLGLAFELTGDHARDAEQVRRYQERNKVDYPVLIAGTADKTGATRAFPALDLVRSYPTTIFLSQDGSVRAVHTGFNGPATGVAYERLREEFEVLIEELLAEPAEDQSPALEFLAGKTFLEEVDIQTSEGRFERELSGLSYSFHKVDDQRLSVQTIRSANADGGSTEPAASTPAYVTGSSLLFGDELFRIDRIADALMDPRSFGRRFVLADMQETAPSTDAELRTRIQSESGASRGETIYELTKLHLADTELGLLPITEWLEDESLQVELAAIWSAGILRVQSVATKLIANLSDPNAAIRRESVLALSRFGIDQTFREFIEKLANDPDPFVKLAVQAALSEE